MHTLKRSWIMLGLIFSFIISCAVRHSAATDVVNPGIYPLVPPVVSFSPLIEKPQHIDTATHKKHSNPEFQDRLTHLLDRSDKAFNNIDEILAINVEWQKRYMRVVDTARNRKKGKDSALLLLHTLQDTVNANKKSNDAFQKKAQLAGFYKEQNKKINDSINWQIYIGFVIVVLLLLINAYLTKRNNRKLTYAQ